MRKALHHLGAFCRALTSPVAYPWFMLGLFAAGTAALIGVLAATRDFY